MLKDSDDERRAKHRAAARAYYHKKKADPEFKARKAAIEKKRRAKPGAVAANNARSAKYRRIKRETDPAWAQRLYAANLARILAKRQAITGRLRPEVCDICGKRPTGRHGLNFDHCHKRGHFRGWICHRCNTVLGRVDDDPRLLTQMIAYLQRTLVNTSPQLSLPGV